MPLPIPDLDDRSFDLLVAEGRALIPRYFPNWTDYNTSDPGIAMLELFAALFEGTHYQLDRVPERSLVKFAALVGVYRLPDESIAALLARVMDTLQQNNNAFTADQMDSLARTVVLVGTVTQSTDQSGTVTATWKSSDSTAFLNSLTQQNAVIAIVQRTQVALAPDCTVQLLIVPGIAIVQPLDAATLKSIQTALTPVGGNDQVPLTSSQMWQQLQKLITPAALQTLLQRFTPLVGSLPATSRMAVEKALCAQVYHELHPQCLLSTRMNVILPEYEAVNIVLTVTRDRHVRVTESALISSIRKALARYVDPLTGGEDGKGWPLGRAIYRSELYQIIEDIHGVDYVARMALSGSPEFAVDEIVDPDGLLALLIRTDTSNKEVVQVRSRLFQEQMTNLTRNATASTFDKRKALVSALNQLLAVNPLLSSDDPILLSYQQQNSNWQTQPLTTLNRALLETIFPTQLSQKPVQEDELRDMLAISSLALPKLDRFQVQVLPEVTR